MASLTLSSLLQPKDGDHVGQARHSLLKLVMTMQMSKIQMFPKAIHKWDKAHCKEKLTYINKIFPSERHENSLEIKDEEGSVDAKRRGIEFVSLMKAAYGVRFAWLLANFPNCHWYFHERRLKAGVELLVALIEFAEGAQKAAPTSNATASHACQTEHLPSSPAAVEDARDQDQDEETTHINEDLDNIQQLQVPSACDQASMTPLSVSRTSMSSIEKRPREYESGIGHSGVFADQRLLYPKAKRICEAPDSRAQLVSENTIGVSTCEVIPSLSSEDQNVVQPQDADGSNSVSPNDECDAYFGLTGVVPATSLKSRLVPSPLAKVETHPWNTYWALKFVLTVVGPKPVHQDSFDDYNYFDIFLRTENVSTLKLHMPMVGKWVTAVENEGLNDVTERIIVALPKDTMADSFLFIRVPYSWEKSQSQSGPQ